MGDSWVGMSHWCDGVAMLASSRSEKISMGVSVSLGASNTDGEMLVLKSGCKSKFRSPQLSPNDSPLVEPKKESAGLLNGDTFP